MTREEALKLISEHVNNRNLIKHMLATEAVMKALAVKFGEDEDVWGISGLLHDIDYDTTVNDFQNHGKISAQILEGKVSIEIIEAIKSHSGLEERVTKMDKALYAVDPLTGLIVASALIHPDKKLASIDADFVLKRFDEKRFAAGANREQIKMCGEIGLTLEEFVDIGVKAMQLISVELGL